ncbi:MAG: hypothetical protein QXU18_12410 [Thermoplasmatales archaeon]
MADPEPEFSYLLGMLVGRGKIIRASRGTGVQYIIEIPHKSLRINGKDASLYVRASVLDIKDALEPFIETNIAVNKGKHRTLLTFSKDGSEMLSRELLKLLGNLSSYKDMRIPQEVFSYRNDLKKEFLKGLADVAAHIRKSNAAYGDPSGNRVYIEVPENWFLVIDICNLLKDVDVPVQDIDWAHPNFRDSKLVKYNQGNKYFWKKEHQIKIYADEFETIGFRIQHKEEMLKELSNENRKEWNKRKHRNSTSLEDVHHKYYWESSGRVKIRAIHPMEDDPSIPEVIRGKHYNSWKQLAQDLGYGEGTHE